MQRACVVCGAISNQARCEQHRLAARGAERRARTVSGWAQQRRAKRILRKHDGICHVCLRPGATEVDHIVALAEGGTDDESNLAPIHSTPCHREKTLKEAARARRDR